MLSFALQSFNSGNVGGAQPLWPLVYMKLRSSWLLEIQNTFENTSDAFSRLSFILASLLLYPFTSIPFNLVFISSIYIKSSKQDRQHEGFLPQGVSTTQGRLPTFQARLWYVWNNRYNCEHYHRCHPTCRDSSSRHLDMLRLRHA